MKDNVGEEAILGWHEERNEKLRILFEMGDGDFDGKKEGPRLILQ